MTVRNRFQQSYRLLNTCRNSWRKHGAPTRDVAFPTSDEASSECRQEELIRIFLAQNELKLGKWSLQHLFTMNGGVGFLFFQIASLNETKWHRWVYRFSIFVSGS